MYESGQFEKKIMQIYLPFKFYCGGLGGLPWSIFWIIKIVMESLISNLIRPYRFTYSLLDLGSKLTERYSREDGNLLNDRGLRIQYSYYKNTMTDKGICMIYAHCNSGCRIQGLQFVEKVVEYGWNVCLFDFGGSGISEGDYISLGHYQSMDLQTVVSEVLRRGNTKIHLWGRSMGAATSTTWINYLIIMYLSGTKQIDSIVSCVLDSPYCSLWRVIRQFGKSKTKIPEFIIEHVMEYMRKIIIKEHSFDIKSLQLLSKVHKISVPIMYIASTSDSFIGCEHAAQLYKWTTSSPKVLEYIDKQHNSPREGHIIHIGLTFMKKCLGQLQKTKKHLKVFAGKVINGHNMAQLITKPMGKRQQQQKNGRLNKKQNKSNILLYCQSSKDTTTNNCKNSRQKSKEQSQIKTQTGIKRFHSFSHICQKPDLTTLLPKQKKQIFISNSNDHHYQSCSKPQEQENYAKLDQFINKNKQTVIKLNPMPSITKIQPPMPLRIRGGAPSRQNVCEGKQNEGNTINNSTLDIKRLRKYSKPSEPKFQTQKLPSQKNKIKYLRTSLKKRMKTETEHEEITLKHKQLFKKGGNCNSVPISLSHSLQSITMQEPTHRIQNQQYHDHQLISGKPQNNNKNQKNINKQARIIKIQLDRNTLTGNKPPETQKIKIKSKKILRVNAQHIRNPA